MLWLTIIVALLWVGMALDIVGRHSIDVLNNRDLDADLGSDGSTSQDRATAAGFRGEVAEAMAINPAPAISGIELINQWHYNRPAYPPV